MYTALSWVLTLSSRHYHLSHSLSSTPAAPTPQYHVLCILQKGFSLGSGKPHPHGISWLLFWVSGFPGWTLQAAGSSSLGS